MNSVEGKVAIITGGGSGIGRACCRLLAQAGAKVVVTDINYSSAQNTVESIREECGVGIAFQHDVSKESDWQEVVDRTIAEFNRLDILVNNAGIVVPKGCEGKSLENYAIHNTSLKDWKTVQSINHDGVFLGIRSAIQRMTSSDQTGSIINISSVAGILYGMTSVPYMASKGGVRMLSKAAAIECKSQGVNIRINTVFPGAIDTPINADESKNKKNERKEKRLLGEPMDIARGVLFLASDDSRFINASELVIDGGLSASMFNEVGS